ncbi:MAG: hypothetical protein U5K27_09890 [Desulfotignum sp.]|nr:hypothetical protein [Desulfotignum sp.]
MLAVIQYMVQELANRKGDELRAYQEQLEQVYLENDLLFNIDPKVKIKIKSWDFNRSICIFP